MARSARTRRGDNVRIGPISIITLISVICMAVLAVLTASTANATLTISERQGQATAYMYANETAAQEFVASVDDVLAGQKEKDPVKVAAAVNKSLDGICQNAKDAVDGDTDVTAKVNKDTVTAEFTTGGARGLSVELVIQDDGTYRIEKWKSTTLQQEAATMGNLWSGGN